LEASVIEAVEAGHMTKDLAILATGRWDVKLDEDFLDTESFMNKIDEIFKSKWVARHGE